MSKDLNDRKKRKKRKAKRRDCDSRGVRTDVDKRFTFGRARDIGVKDQEHLHGIHDRFNSTRQRRFTAKKKPSSRLNGSLDPI